MPKSPDQLRKAEEPDQKRKQTLERYCRDYGVETTPGVALCDPDTALTVVVPAFNEQDFIPLCLEQLGKSTVPIEIVVVDNNSTDKTTAAAISAGKDIPFPVTVLHATQKGPVHARKRGMDETVAQYLKRGNITTPRYMALTDADTLVPPDWAASIVSVATETRAEALGGKYHYPYELDDIIEQAKGVSNFFRYLGEVAYYLSDTGVAFIHTCGANFAIEVEPYAAIGGSQQPRDAAGNQIKGNDLRFGHAVRALGGSVAFIPTQTIPSARREIFALSQKAPQNKFSSMQGWVDCRISDIELLESIVADLDAQDLLRHREERASRFMFRTIILPAFEGELNLDQLARVVGDDDSTLLAIKGAIELIKDKDQEFTVELARNLSMETYRDLLDKIWILATKTEPPKL